MGPSTEVGPPQDARKREPTPLQDPAGADVLGVGEGLDPLGLLRGEEVRHEQPRGLAQSLLAPLFGPEDSTADLESRVAVDAR